MHYNIENACYQDLSVTFQLEIEKPEKFIEYIEYIYGSPIQGWCECESGSDSPHNRAQAPRW